MVKLGISIKSSTYLIRRLLKTMTSLQGYGISCSLCHCRKSAFTRTVTSSCTDSGQGKATVESRDCRSTEREGLQWDKLSEDEKNIYLAHKNACMVMHLSMLSCWGGKGGVAGYRRGFKLRSVFLFKVFLFKCPVPGNSSRVEKVRIPHSRSIIVGRKNSTNSPPMPGFPPPLQWLNTDFVFPKNV